MMVGQKVELEIERPVTKIDRPLLEIRDLSVRSDEGSIAIEGLNFFIRGGEILGVAGIAGCGQRELCEAIAGLRKVESGGIYHEGDSIVGFSPKQIAARGISMSFIPEDRLGMGLAPSMSITDNMMLKKYQDHRYSIKPVAAKEGEKPFAQKCRRAWNAVTSFINRRVACPFVDRKTARAEAERVIKKLDVVTPSTETPVSRLSGGNVQKVLLGREILIEPNVLITAYPVRGLDINSSYLIYDILNRQKEAGTGILFIGEDLDVMLALCDKIMVLCHGKLMGVVHAEKTTKEQLGLMMAGALNLEEEKGKEMGVAKDSRIGEEHGEQLGHGTHKGTVHSHHQARADASLEESLYPFRRRAHRAHHLRHLHFGVGTQFQGVLRVFRIALFGCVRHGAPLLAAVAADRAFALRCACPRRCLPHEVLEPRRKRTGTHGLSRVRHVHVLPGRKNG